MRGKGVYSLQSLQKAIDTIMQTTECDELLNDIDEHQIVDERALEDTLKSMSTHPRWKDVTSKYLWFYEHHILDIFRLLDS